jgi:hypothetical protein
MNTEGSESAQQSSAPFQVAVLTEASPEKLACEDWRIPALGLWIHKGQINTVPVRQAQRKKTNVITALYVDGRIQRNGIRVWFQVLLEPMPEQNELNVPRPIVKVDFTLEFWQ